MLEWRQAKLPVSFLRCGTEKQRIYEQLRY